MRKALIVLAIAAAANVNVSIHEYDLPVANSRPHDPAVGSDGALWYTAQHANAIGRVDPVTGIIKQYELKTANSGPHGLVADSAGNIWFTANYAGYIGKLDPRNGDVTEFKINDRRGHDPHTPAIAPDGRLCSPPRRGTSSAFSIRRAAR